MGVSSSASVVPTLILLQGPPGSGKSEFLKLALKSLVAGMPGYLGGLYVVALSDLTPKWRGSDVADIENVFFAATHPRGPTTPFLGVSVIVIDEMGAFCRRTDGPDTAGTMPLVQTLTDLLTRPVHLGFAGTLLVLGTVNEGLVSPAINSRAVKHVLMRPDFKLYLHSAQRVVGLALETAFPGVLPQYLAPYVSQLVDSKPVQVALKTLWGVSEGDMRPLVAAAKVAIVRAAGSATGVRGTIGTGGASSPCVAPLERPSPPVCAKVALQQLFARERTVAEALRAMQATRDTQDDSACVLPLAVTERLPTEATLERALLDAAATQDAVQQYNADESKWG
jgi:hypothetical protein